MSLLLAEVKGWQPEEDKAPGWAKEDAASSLERQADLLAEGGGRADHS